MGKGQLSFKNNLESDIMQKLQDATSESRNTILARESCRRHRLKTRIQGVKATRLRTGRLWAALLPGVLPKMTSLQMELQWRQRPLAPQRGGWWVSESLTLWVRTSHLDLKTSAYAMRVSQVTDGIDSPDGTQGFSGPRCLLSSSLSNPKPPPTHPRGPHSVLASSSPTATTDWPFSTSLTSAPVATKGFHV